LQRCGAGVGDDESLVVAEAAACGAEFDRRTAAALDESPGRSRGVWRTAGVDRGEGRIGPAIAVPLTVIGAFQFPGTALYVANGRLVTMGTKV